MTPYPEYKPTGLPWLPQIPKDWNLLPLRCIFEERKEKNSKGQNNNILSVTCNRGVIPYSEKGNVGNKCSEDITRYCVVHKGDIVLNCMNVIIGSVGKSLYNGVLSPVYYVLKNRVTTVHNTDFFAYVFRMPTFYKGLKIFGKGILDHRLRIAMTDLKTVMFPVPSPTEQAQIVRYLDAMTAKINKLIRAKKKEIALLQEQKQAIINRAVTKGLNPNAEMKDSGIDWLGKIPTHWEVKPLKRVCKINASIGHLLKDFSDDSLVTFLPMEAISVDGKIDCSQKQPLKNVKSGFSSFAVNDVVVAKITPCFENGKGACLDALDTVIGYGTTELIVLRGFKNEINQQFLYQVTKITSFRKNGAEVMTGSAGQKRVPANFIANFTCGIPPLEEQNEIVQYLVERNAFFEKALDKVKKEIEVMFEYKNSLISSVVTGQVDVRNIAADDVAPEDFATEEESVLDDEEETNATESEE